MPRPIEASIDLAALRHNYLEVKRRTPAAKAWAVVKANAYGHGIGHAWKALDTVADGFGLLDLDEAVHLRQLGARQPILLLEGVFRAGDLDVAREFGLSATLHCRDQVDMLLARPATAVPLALPLVLKFNTGMNRLGFVDADLPWLAERLPQLSHAGLTLMTHFADADGPRGIAWQMERFAAMTARWADLKLPVSLCNSAAILRYPEIAGSGGDWVRPGIMLYGASPFADQSAASLGLRPVMTLASEIIAVQEVAAGASVGYGCTFTAERAMRVGIVACGYADGYPRQAPTGTPVLVDGVRTRTLGRVSMDMIAVDLSPLPQAGLGTKVSLWGTGLPVEEVAAAAETISYELLCALSMRVPVREV